MNVILYNTYDDKRKLSKDLTQVASATCVLKDSTDKNNPFIILAGDYDCNYMYMDGKYYYLTDKSYDQGHRVIYKATVDVLMTYADDIRSCQAICIRSNRRADNLYLDDESAYVMQNKVRLQVLNFSRGFNESGEFILVTAGGDAEEVTTNG